MPNVNATDSSSRDEAFMRAALAEARKALEQGEVPAGAVLVRGDEVIARGHNSPISRNDPSAHAEIMALREGGRTQGNYRLSGTEMYVTLEPCIMCMGALVHARVERLIFGAYDPRTGAAGSVFDFSEDERLNHRIEVRAGVLEPECRELLQDFFKSKRRDGRAG